MRVHITTSLEESSRRSPCSRVGVATADVRWDAATRKEPDADGLARPFGGIYTTTIVVESISVRLRVTGGDAASGVGGLSLGVDIAVGA